MISAVLPQGMGVAFLEQPVCFTVDARRKCRCTVQKCSQCSGRVLELAVTRWMRSRARHLEDKVREPPTKCVAVCDVGVATSYGSRKSDGLFLTLVVATPVVGTASVDSI